MWRTRLVFLVLALSGAACGAAREPVGRVGISLEDARLVAAVRTAILNDPQVGQRQIAIESRGGIVTLSGSVASSPEIERAVELTRGVGGVREVKSQLRVESPVPAR